MSTPESYEPTNIELLTRCTDYVHGWFGVDSNAGMQGREVIPELARAVHVNMYDTLSKKDLVSDETLSAVGMRAIGKALYPRPKTEDRNIRLVPRIVEPVTSEISTTSPVKERRNQMNSLNLPVMPSFRPGEFTRRAKNNG